VLIGVFGVPQHEDDAVRGIKAALDINYALTSMSMVNHIGVT
jgi:hypothetical protein